MLTKEVLVKRVDELSKSVSESLESYNRSKIMLDNMAHQHNALSGRLEEAAYLYKKMVKEDEDRVAAEYNERLNQETEKGMKKTKL